MIVLGIESSCDETAAALVRDGANVLAGIVASQVQIHRDYGGVVPELASREHVENLPYVLQACFDKASENLGREFTSADVDGVAATRGPGLMGALLVGLTYAKALAYAWEKPFVGINHLEGHLGSIFLDDPEAETPALSLVVSGGHTNLYWMERPGQCQLLARTLDDAAGEAFDKLAKLLGLGYPGGPRIDRLARGGNPEAVSFSLPKISDGSLAYSFSGLKTAALRYVRERGLAPADEAEIERRREDENVGPEIRDLLASYQKAIIDQLLDRMDSVLASRTASAIHLSGGVSCNSELRRRAKEHFEAIGLPVYYPRPDWTTDNAVMIAAAGYWRLKNGQRDPFSLPADPNLRLNP